VRVRCEGADSALADDDRTGGWGGDSLPQRDERALKCYTESRTGAGDAARARWEEECAQSVVVVSTLPFCLT